MHLVVVNPITILALHKSTTGEEDPKPLWFPAIYARVLNGQTPDLVIRNLKIVAIINVLALKDVDVARLKVIATTVQFSNVAGRCVHSIDCDVHTSKGHSYGIQLRNNNKCSNLDAAEPTI
jgi:hypothetical protein